MDEVPVLEAWFPKHQDKHADGAARGANTSVNQLGYEDCGTCVLGCAQSLRNLIWCFSSTHSGSIAHRYMSVIYICQI